MKNIFKRTLALSLALIMLFAMSACSEEFEVVYNGTLNEKTESEKTENGGETCALPDSDPPVDPQPGVTYEHPDVDITDIIGEDPYYPMSMPVVSSTVYGESIDHLVFNDVWGAMEYIPEGENAGALHFTEDGGAGMALIRDIDFSKAKKVTLSAYMMIPEEIKGENQNIGIIVNSTADISKSPYYWETSFNSFIYAFIGNNNTDTAACSGICVWGIQKNIDRDFLGWASLGESDGLVTPSTKNDSRPFGEYFKVTVVWDAETMTLELYYNGQLSRYITFEEYPLINPFSDNPTFGFRSHTGDTYIKDISLIVE